MFDHFDMIEQDQQKRSNKIVDLLIKSTIDGSLTWEKVGNSYEASTVQYRYRLGRQEDGTLLLEVKPETPFVAIYPTKDTPALYSLAVLSDTLKEDK